MFDKARIKTLLKLINDRVKEIQHSGQRELITDHLAELEQELDKPSDDSCSWSRVDHEDNFETGCNNLFSFYEGDAKMNNFKVCPFCGRKII